VAKENKYLFTGLAFLAMFMLAVIVESFRHVPQVVAFILYAMLAFPGFVLIYLARQEMVRVVKELWSVRSQSARVTDTKAARDWRIRAVTAGVIGSALAYFGRRLIMDSNKVLPSVVGWIALCIGMMIVGVAFVLGKFADL